MSSVDWWFRWRRRLLIIIVKTLKALSTVLLETIGNCHREDDLCQQAQISKLLPLVKKHIFPQLIRGCPRKPCSCVHFNILLLFENFIQAECRALEWSLEVSSDELDVVDAILVVLWFPIQFYCVECRVIKRVKLLFHYNNQVSQNVVLLFLHVISGAFTDMDVALGWWF